MNSPVTIVVVPRDRFSRTRPALESVYRHTTEPFDLVYVDGNSPAATRKYLENESAARGFRLIRVDRLLAPNQARNIGLQDVRSDYVVFLDNDAEVEAGWLTHLLACAEETGAWAVTPLVLESMFDRQIIHTFGGRADIVEENGVRSFHEDHVFNLCTVDEVRPELRRAETGFFEFHCVLLRREVFERLGPCDERYLSNCEHLDLSLLIREAGGRVFVEPASRVIFPHNLLDQDDIDYVRVRWSDSWNRQSATWFVEKWNIDRSTPWTAATIEWANEHRKHLERMQRSPVSILKSAIRRAWPQRAFFR